MIAYRRTGIIMNKRTITITAAVLALLLLAAGGLYGLREVIIGPRLLAAANSYLAPALGVELQADQIGGNYYNTLLLKDVRTVEAAKAGDADSPGGDPSPPLLKLQAHQVRLAYHLPALRHGLTPFLATLSVELQQGSLTVTPADTAEAPPRSEPGLPQLAAINHILDTTAELAAILPALTIRQLDFHLYSKDLVLYAEALDLELSPATATADGLSQLNLHSPKLSLNHPRLQKQQAPLKLELRARANNPGGEITIPRLDWDDLLTISAGRLHWSGGEDGEDDPARHVPAEAAPLAAPPRIGLELPLRVLTTDVNLQGELTPENWRWDLASEPFDLAELPLILAEPPHLAGEIRARSQLDFAPDAPLATLNGELEIQLRRGEWAKHRLDDMDLKTSFRHGEMQLARLTARLGDNHLDLHGLQLPLDAVNDGDIRQLLKQGELAELKIDFRDLPDLLAIAGLSPETTHWAGLNWQRLQLEAGLAQGVLSLQNSRLEGDPGHFDLARATIGPWPRDDDFWNLPLAGEMSLAMDRLDDISAAWAAWQLPELSGQIRADLALEGSPADPRGRLSLEGTALSWQDLTLDLLKLEVRGDRRRLHIDDFLLRRDADYFRAGVILDPDSILAAIGESSGETVPDQPLWQQLTWEDLDSSLAMADIAAYTEFLPPPWQLGGSLQGEISGGGSLRHPHLEGSLQLENIRPPGFTASPLQKPEPGQMPTVDEIATAFRIDDKQLEISHLTIRHGEDRLRAGGRVLLPAGGLKAALRDPADLPWRDFTARLTVTELAAYADFVFPHRLPADPAGADYAANFPAGALTVELSGEGSLARHSLSAAVQLERARLGEFGLASGKGDFDFSLPAGEPANLQLAGDFQARGLAKNETPLLNELEARLHFDHHRLTVEYGQLVSDHGRLQLTGELDGPATANPELRLSRLELTTDDINLALDRPGRLRFGDGRLLEAELDLRGHGAAISLRGGYDPAAAGEEMNFRARVHSDELSWLSPLLPGIRRLDGSVVAELDLSGSPDDPRTQGTITLENGELRPEGDAPGLREISGEARFDHDGLELLDLAGLWGGAPFDIRGRVDFPPGFPLAFAADRFTDELVFDLELRGEELLFYRAEGIRVRGRTDLAVTGPLSRLHLAGVVAVTDGRYIRNVDFLEMFRGPGGPQRRAGLRLFSLTSSPWRDMTFNIRLIADQPFVVHNNMARGGLRPNLRLRGTGELPVLVGEIYLDPTRLTLPSGRFQVESGLIRFPDHDPDRPEFDILASARLLGYDINIVLQGTADEPVLTLSSTPPLADDELMLLVLTGQPPAALGPDAARRRAGLNVALFLGRDLLARIFHGDEPPSDEAILERFHIEVGRDITRSGDETIEAELWLTDDLIRTGDRLYITSEKDIYDDFNLGLKIVFRFR